MSVGRDRAHVGRRHIGDRTHVGATLRAPRGARMTVVIFALRGFAAIIVLTMLVPLGAHA